MGQDTINKIIHFQYVYNKPHLESDLSNYEACQYEKNKWQT